MQQIGFFALAAIAIVAATRIVTGKNLVHSIGFHVVMLVCIAGLYGLLSAQFMAVVQVLVYVAAVTILLVFALMLTPIGRGAVQALDHAQRGRAVLTALAMVGLLLFVILQTKWPQALVPSNLSTDKIGRALLTTYALPFEIVSLLLLAALVGVIVVAAKHEEGEG